MPEKCLYNTDDYKIYGAFVNSFEYKDIKIGKYGTATIVGNFQELNLGIEYIVTAKEEIDKKGYKYVVTNIKREKPNSVESSRAFLYEIITPSQADVLLEAYPDIIDRIIHNRLDDIDLSKTYNIKDYIFNVIKRKVIENFKLAELVEEFQGLFNIGLLKKLHDKYPSVEKIREVLRDDPYDCLCNISGIGFKTADSMLLSIDKQSKENITKGLKPILFFNYDLKTSLQRTKACVEYLLDENENEGHTYLSLSTLKKQCMLLVKDSYQHLVTVLKNTETFYIDKDKLAVAKRSTYETELYIATRLKEALNCKILWDIVIEKYRNLGEFTLTDLQMNTLNKVCNNNLIVLNGYGGTGKSASTKALINMLIENNKTFSLFAPTGRAAKVLSSYTDQSASTIHRGLGYRPPSDWGFNENYPLSTDIVIVDEFSMTDIFLFKHLLEAIDFKKTKLLLIGDDGQIPSVGAGNILYDILNSEIIPTVTLDQIFRYGEGGLMTVATDTRMGKEYLNEESNNMQIFGADKSYVFFPVSQEKTVDNVVALYTKLVKDGNSLDDIIVLSCYNKGEYGTIEINNKIQSAVNPNRDKFIKFGETEFRINDMVMQWVNDYKAVLCDNGYPTENLVFIANGEIGKIIKVDYNSIVVDFDGIQIYYSKPQLNNLKLAYAISTHKSQGGQFKIVILATPKAHTYMLNSNLLYVGESRAKEKCYHFSDIKTVHRAIKKKENFDRNTFLLDLLTA